MKAMFETSKGDRIIFHMDEAGKLHVEIISEAEVHNYVIDSDEALNLVSHLKDLKNRHFDLIASNRSIRQKLARTIIGTDERV